MTLEIIIHANSNFINDSSDSRSDNSETVKLLPQLYKNNTHQSTVPEVTELEHVSDF